MDLKNRARRLKAELPAIYLALRHPDTPLLPKLLAGLTVAYALSPVDLIPDFVPVLGYLDDVLVLPALIALTVRRIPPEVLASCRERAEGMWQNGRPKKWYFALPVVGAWLLLALLVVKVIF